ncbi:MAG: polysaccharide biosynthesis tyrosine autokinase [Fibrobacter sp.]|nr:polysaccharide biosynthesis tyrosine autokinase [Fibrobacter sp.]
MATALIDNIRSKTLKDYFAVIFRRKWIIIFSFLSTVLSTIYYVNQIKDIYESYSTIVIEEQNVYVNQMMTTNSRPLSFYEGILNSRTFLETVLDSVGFMLILDYFPKMSRDDALLYIQNSISLKKTTFNSFLQLNVRTNSQELSFKIAQTGTEILRTRCQEVASEETRRGIVEIEKQIGLIRKNLELAEHDYRSYIEKTGQIQEGTTPELKTLQQAYADILAQIGLKKADLDAEKKLLAKLELKISPGNSIASSEYFQLRSKLSDLEKEKLRLEGLGIRLSGISTIDREIQEAENKLLELKKNTSTPVDPATMRQWQESRKSVLTKETEIELFKRKMESYEKAINSYKAGNPDILTQSLELLRLKRAKEIYENIYSMLLEKAEEQKISSASNSAGIKIVDMPVMPQKPIARNETRFYILGIILGLGLGLALAFLIEFNDTTIKSNEDIERFLKQSVLGTIPHINHNKKDEVEIRRNSSAGKHKGIHITQYPRHVFKFDGDDSVITEAYRSLRTNLTFASPDKPLQAIVLTSAGPSEGKSLTISNLAMAYAQMGKKTLLIDTDLRRPVLHHIFNMKREPGFVDLFIDNPDYDKIIQKTEKDNLFVIPAGIFTPNPAELIASNKMMLLIEYFRNNFDIIFFDTPPIIAVTDATLLASKTDGLILVVKSHHTDKDVALRAINNLNHVGVKILGTVLNDINLSNRYSSYGYYKYYYHYYKSKKD